MIHVPPSEQVSATPMVELRTLSKRYGDTAALSTVDLTVPKGQFVTLLGPSGSGKTTLLNLIAGMVRPTEGRVFIAGRDVTDLPPGERGLGMVFQNYALMPHMTVFENIAFPLRVRRVTDQEIRRRVADVLSLIKLPHVAKRYPRELSGGQQQRISLARCIVYEPSLILMDEPLGALDKKLREQIQLEIKQIHAQLGVTILYVTHDQEEALTMSDHIVLMRDGRIEQQGPPDDLYFRPQTVFAADFIGSSNLFEARVIRVGESVDLSIADGTVTAPKPDFPISLGDPVTCLVRPENLDLSASTSARRIAFEGRYIDSIVLGGVVKHFVTLASGTPVVVQEPNRLGRVPLGGGQTVQVGWEAEHCRLLPAGIPTRPESES